MGTVFPAPAGPLAGGPTQAPTPGGTPPPPPGVGPCQGTALH